MGNTVYHFSNIEQLLVDDKIKKYATVISDLKIWSDKTFEFNQTITNENEFNPLKNDIQQTIFKGVVKLTSNVLEFIGNFSESRVYSDLKDKPFYEYLLPDLADVSSTYLKEGKQWVYSFITKDGEKIEDATPLDCPPKTMIVAAIIDRNDDLQKDIPILDMDQDLKKCQYLQMDINWPNYMKTVVTLRNCAIPVVNNDDDIKIELQNTPIPNQNNTKVMEQIPVVNHTEMKDL